VYEIEFTKKATKELKAIDKKIAVNLIKKIYILSKDPYAKVLDIKKLKGIKNVYRLRYREYRVIYEINNNKLVITIIKVGARGGVYG
jgi:mRNA interferase RelE/StbE